jgi:FMN phosphatase YigB (HAD superfamily)
MRRVRLVVTDLDNTLYSWVGYVVHAIDAMVQSLCTSTGEAYDDVLGSLKEVYSRRGSIEYPFVIQEAAIFQDRIGDFERFAEDVLVPARRAFAEQRTRYLRPYDGVVETLDEIRAQGVRIVGLSDANSFSATLRLRMLGLDRQLEALYAIQPYELPSDGRIERRILEKLEAGLYEPETLRVVHLPLSAVKPSDEGLEQICAHYGVRPDETLIVGDNLTKDIGLAQKAGALDLWAEYGTRLGPELRQGLERFVPGNVARRNAPELEGSDIRPSVALQSFSELLAAAQLQSH